MPAHMSLGVHTSAHISGHTSAHTSLGEHKGAHMCAFFPRDPLYLVEKFFFTHLHFRPKSVVATSVLRIICYSCVTTVENQPLILFE